MRTGWPGHPVVYFDNRMTRQSGLQFFEIVNRMGDVFGSHFQKIKSDNLVIRLRKGGVLLR